MELVGGAMSNRRKTRATLQTDVIGVNITPWTRPDDSSGWDRVGGFRLIEVEMMVDASDTSAKDHVILEPTCLGGVLPAAARHFGDAPALFFEGEWSSFR
jgi:hypothetical protein